MKKTLLTLTLGVLITGCSSASNPSNTDASLELEWQSGANVEQFWQDYVELRGGLTWGKTTEYPDYDKVQEGDTMIIELAQGPCLMEFFHSRWRRANDVRRWHESVNEYGGCPYVFD